MKRLSTAELLERYHQGERLFENLWISGDTSLQRTDLSEIIFRQVTLHEVDLTEARLEGALLEETTIEYARLQRTSLANATLRRGSIQSSNLEGVDLEGATLVGISLQGIHLPNTIFHRATLTDVDLQNANLQGSDLTAAKLSRLDVRGANLSNVLISMTTIRDMTRDISTRWEPIYHSGGDSRKSGRKRHTQLPLMEEAPIRQEAEEDLPLPGFSGRVPLANARKYIQKMLKKHFGQTGRVGQSHFRAEMFRAYTKQCALTGCQIEETLEAAHIIPYCLTQNHEPWNGLLLRSDVHRLFDLNLLRIDPITLVAQFDKRILEREPSYQMIEGKMIQTPQIGISSSFSPYERPWRQALEWRRDYYQQLVEGFLP